MRKSLVALLAAGLLLLGVTPVWAAGQAMAAVPAQQDEVVQVVVPGGDALSEQELKEVKGELAPQVWGALIGAVTGAWAGYHDAGWKGAAVGAVIGAAAGYMAATVGPAAGALTAELGRRMVYNPIVHGKKRHNSKKKHP